MKYNPLLAFGLYSNLYLRGRERDYFKHRYMKMVDAIHLSIISVLFIMMRKIFAFQ